MTGLLAALAQATEPGAPVDPSVAVTSGTAEFVVFWVVAPLALASAISVIVLRNAVHAALLLVLNFFAIAVLYAVLEAQFLAVVQLIVYAGAIMVLFLFVLMLIGVDRDLAFTERLRGQKAAAVLLGITLFGALMVGVAGRYLGRDSACTGASERAAGESDEDRCAGLGTVNAAEEGGNVGGIGELLFTDYVWPFEVTSVLLVIAALGAMVMGRRDEDEDDLVDVPRSDHDPRADEPDEDDPDEDEPEDLPRQRELEAEMSEHSEEPLHEGAS